MWPTCSPWDVLVTRRHCRRRALVCTGRDLRHAQPGDRRADRRRPDAGAGRAVLTTRRGSKRRLGGGCRGTVVARRLVFVYSLAAHSSCRGRGGGPGGMAAIAGVCEWLAAKSLDRLSRRPPVREYFLVRFRWVDGGRLLRHRLQHSPATRRLDSELADGGLGCRHAGGLASRASPDSRVRRGLL